MVVLLRLALLLILLLPGTAAAQTLVRGPYTQVAGPADTRLHDPRQVAAAADGRIAVADGNSRVVVFRGDGTPLWSRPTHWATGVAFGPGGDVHTAEDGRIRRFRADGGEQTPITAGLTDGRGFVRPYRIAVGGDGRIHAMAGERLMTWTPDGALERTRDLGFDTFWIGTVAADAGGRIAVSTPQGIDVRAADHTLVKHVTDQPGRVAFDAAGRLRAWIGDEYVTYDADYVQASARPAAPLPEQVDGTEEFAVTADGTYLVTVSQRDQLVRMAADGTMLAPLGLERGAGISRGVDVAVLPGGDAVVADVDDRRVIRFAPDGGVRAVLLDDAEDLTGVAAYPDGDVLVSAGGEHVENGYEVVKRGSLRRVGPDGTVRWTLPLDGAIPRSPAVAPDGTAWVRHAGTVVRVDPAGTRTGGFVVDPAVEFDQTAPGLGVLPSGQLVLNERDGVVVRDQAGTIVRSFAPDWGLGIDVSGAGVIALATGHEWYSLLTPDGTSLLRQSWSPGQPTTIMDLAFADNGQALYLLSDGGGHLLRAPLTLELAPSGPQPVPTTTPPAPAPAPALTVVKPRRAIRLTRKGTARLTVRCAAAACTGRVSLAGKRRAGTARVRLGVGDRRRVAVPVKRWARRATRRGPVRMRATTTVAGGTGGAVGVRLRPAGAR